MYQLQLPVLAATWEATYYMGFDCYGNDIGGSNVNSVDECQWLCQVSLYKPTCIILAMTEIVFASDATGVLRLRLRCSSLQYNVLHQERLPCTADAVIADEGYELHIFVLRTCLSGLQQSLAYYLENFFRR